MRVTARVKEDVASALRKGQTAAPGLEALVRATEELGVVLEPVHPDTEDASLAPYFTLEVPDRTKAEQTISRLQDCEAVEAAYFKPSDESP